MYNCIFKFVIILVILDNNEDYMYDNENSLNYSNESLTAMSPHSR